MSRLVVRDVAVLDATGAEPDGRHDVLIEDGRIAKVTAECRKSPRRIATLDGAGLTLMPGLTDAHVHFALIADDAGYGSDGWVAHVLAVAQMIERSLDEGFTTVRDAGGLEPAWATAVADGHIRGPRILPSGSVIGQTGGHGDVRLAHHAVHAGQTIPGLAAAPVVVDGADEVRKAAREQLRRGATQVKVMASGGIVSPTDPFDSIQLSAAEIGAAVEVARSWGTYVLAHCHTSPAIDIAIEAGVRSIEHGSILEPSTARRMAELGAFMVPTLQALEMLAAHSERWGLTPAKVARLGSVRDAMYESIRAADAAGVQIASGSDVVGPWQGNRGEEIEFKARVMGAHRAIISATRTNAELFEMAADIGTVEVGKRADLVLVDGAPLDDVSLFSDPDNIAVVLLGGDVVKDRAGRLAPSS